MGQPDGRQPQALASPLRLSTRLNAAMALLHTNCRVWPALVATTSPKPGRPTAALMVTLTSLLQWHQQRKNLKSLVSCKAVLTQQMENPV